LAAARPYRLPDHRRYLLDPDGGRISYDGDPAGRLTVLPEPRGPRTTFVHETAGRRTPWLDSGAPTTYAWPPLGDWLS
jgi:hypothetical protein